MSPITCSGIVDARRRSGVAAAVSPSPPPPPSVPLTSSTTTTTAAAGDQAAERELQALAARRARLLGLLARLPLLATALLLLLAVRHGGEM